MLDEVGMFTPEMIDLLTKRAEKRRQGTTNTPGGAPHDDMKPGERCTPDGINVYEKHAPCGTLLHLGRVWKVGQTVDEIVVFCCPVCEPERWEALSR